MINNIAQGRLNKFLKENTLMDQDFIDDSKMSVKDFLNSVEKGLACTGFFRQQLGA